MPEKSIYLAALALLAAGGSAHAADAIVLAPEPEPMEYVRVCDVYGAGFFYIPGTETCLKISGFVFYQMGATGDDGLADTPNYHGFDSDQFSSYLRTRINFDARSDTELGTLRSYIRLQSDYTNGAPSEFGDRGNDPNLGLDAAWLSLGGLRVGYADSAWKNTVNGGASGGGTHSWSALDYGSIQRQFVQYNFTAGNFFATVSLEQDPSGDLPDTANYVPDVVAKAGVKSDWGTLWGQVGVDETSADTGVKGSGAGGLATGDTEYAASAGLSLNMPGMEGDSLRLIGYYSSDANAYWNYGEWSVLGSYYHQFTPKFGASVGAQYISDVNYGLDGSPDLYLGELSLVWLPVQDFEVRSELTYAKLNGDTAFGDRDGSLSGFLRLTRYFGG